MLIKRLILLWQQSLWQRFFARQTQSLGLCLLAAYGVYLLWLGIRPIVVLSGALICILSLFLWLLSSRPSVEKQDDSDLLDKTVFHTRLEALCSLSRNAGPRDAGAIEWQKQYAQAKEIYQIVSAIARRAPLFIPDLLDTLHTVLELLSQFTQAFLATQKIKTLQYQKIAQQQLLASTYRLNQTLIQLQELHDQLMTEDMDMRSSKLSSGVSSRLQVLITSNKSELATNQSVH